MFGMPIGCPSRSIFHLSPPCSQPQEAAFCGLRQSSLPSGSAGGRVRQQTENWEKEKLWFLPPPTPHLSSLAWPLACQWPHSSPKAMVRTAAHPSGGQKSHPVLITALLLPPSGLGVAVAPITQGFRIPVVFPQLCLTFVSSPVADTPQADGTHPPHLSASCPCIIPSP